MSGVIGIGVSAETARFNAFWRSFATMFRDEPVAIQYIPSYDAARARNKMVEIAKQENADWLWILDDDQPFPQDSLRKLLAHNVPLVQPLILKREPPFPTLQLIDPGGGTRWTSFVLDETCVGLKPVDVLGCGGLLMRRIVWETLPMPLFRCGQFQPGMMQEDVWFCVAAKKAGFQPYVDCENRQGHCVVAEVWPERTPEGTWVTKVTIGQYDFYLPTAEAASKGPDHDRPTQKE